MEKDTGFRERQILIEPLISPYRTRQALFLFHSSRSFGSDVSFFIVSRFNRPLYQKSPPLFSFSLFFYHLPFPCPFNVLLLVLLVSKSRTFYAFFVAANRTALANARNWKRAGRRKIIINAELNWKSRNGKNEIRSR